MTKVIGVRFRTAGKIYYFDPMDLEMKRDDHVIVETARGIEFGTVVLPPKEVEDSQITQPLKQVLRLATPVDIQQEADNKVREREAFKMCQAKIREHNLEMKLIDAEYTFDNNKVLFYFTADGRIDFRELVKDLAAVFRTRIELRQIGVRDETKIVGGIGICGRPLCCHTHLADFAPVSIKMAKEQNLSLNPTKISGVCGRLMCCLNHEEETYEELNKKLPRPGDTVVAADGVSGDVHSVNILRGIVKVLVENGDEKELVEYPADELTFKRRGKKGKKEQEVDTKALQELEQQEALDQQEKAEQKEASEHGKKDHGNHHDKGDGRENRENRGKNRREHRQEKGAFQRKEKQGKSGDNQAAENGQGKNEKFEHAKKNNRRPHNNRHGARHGEGKGGQTQS